MFKHKTLQHPIYVSMSDISTFLTLFKEFPQCLDSRPVNLVLETLIEHKQQNVNYIFCVDQIVFQTDKRNFSDRSWRYMYKYRYLCYLSCIGIYQPTQLQVSLSNEQQTFAFQQLHFNTRKYKVRVPLAKSAGSMANCLIAENYD